MMLGTRDLRTNPRPPRSHRVWPPAPRIRSTRTADRDGRAIAISPRLPFRLQVLAREKRGNARGTTDAFLAVKTMAQRDQHKGSAARSECATTSRTQSGACANTYALSSTTAGWTSIAPTSSVGQEEPERGLSWSAAPGTSLPPIPVSAGLTWLRSAPFLVCPLRHSEGDDEENHRAPSAQQDSEPLSQCINRSSASISAPTSLRRLRCASDAHAPRANSQTNGPYSAKAAAPQTKPITIQFHTSSEL